MDKKVLVLEHYLHPQCISPGMLSCFTFLNWNKQIAISSEIHSGLTKSYMSKAIGGVKFRRDQPSGMQEGEKFKKDRRSRVIILQTHQLRFIEWTWWELFCELIVLRSEWVITLTPENVFILFIVHEFSLYTFSERKNSAAGWDWSWWQECWYHG